MKTRLENDKSCTNDESNFKHIITGVKLAVVKFNKDLSITDFSGYSEQIFGFKKEEVIGKKLEDTIVPRFESTGRKLEGIIDKLLLDTQKYEYNINENVKKDGTRIWMQWYNSKIKNSRNELLGVMSVGLDITARVNMEIALKESEERFRMLSDLTFEGILIHDNGVILDVNLSFERQIGYTREELIGDSLFEKLIPPKHHKIMLENIRNNVTHYETEAKHRSGKIIPISIEAKKVKLGDKRVRVVAVRDISDLKKTINELEKYKNHLEELVEKRTEKIDLQSKKLHEQNEALQFEKNQLRIVIDNIPDAIYIKDNKSRFLNVNTRLMNILKSTDLNEVLGKTDFDFFPDSLANKFYSDEQKICETGNALIRTEEPGIDENGNEIFVQTTKVPIKDADGNVTSIVGIGRDITQKKVAEERLRKQANKLRKKNTLLNERAVKIKILNEDLKHTNEKLESANHILREQKEEIEVTLEQLRLTQTQLVQSEKMASLGILTAGIAHEINNPVNFVYAGVNSLIKDFNDIRPIVEEISSLKSGVGNLTQKLQKIEKLKAENEFDIAFEAIPETIADIKLGASRISDIVSGLSRFSRLETEKWKMADLHEELDGVLILLKNKYKHHIEIIKNYGHKVPMIECFPGKLNQVFMNIINNAIDAIEDKQGEIAIKTSCSGKTLNISIKDTGSGINDEDRLKIFDPFFTTKDVGNGIGLGLAISYSIIQEHNGEIIVNSILNKGTEFIINIPVLQNK